MMHFCSSHIYRKWNHVADALANFGKVTKLCLISNILYYFFANTVFNFHQIANLNSPISSPPSIFVSLPHPNSNPNYKHKRLEIKHILEKQSPN